jgi:hypothetical protein
MSKTKYEICLHEAAHAGYALELGFRVVSMMVGDARSRVGARLGGYTEYEHKGLTPDYDYLQERAIIAYAGAAVVGFGAGRPPLEVIEREDDDRGSIAEFSKCLKESGVSEQQIADWRFKAWTTANELAPKLLPRIKALGRTLFEAGSMNEDQIKEAWHRARVRVLIIGTSHEFQRHQDTEEGREKVRADFATLLRSLVKEHNITLIAEEAGDDKAVWELLKKEEEAVGEFVEAFGGGRVASEPVPTIARIIGNEHSGRVRHVDIRADATKLPLVEERDEAMASKVVQILESAESLLVIVGEEHRVGVSARLEKQGLAVKSITFPKPSVG